MESSESFACRDQSPSLQEILNLHKKDLLGVFGVESVGLSTEFDSLMVYYNIDLMPEFAEKLKAEVRKIVGDTRVSYGWRMGVKI